MFALRYWLGLLALVAVWGSSYALIEVALPIMGPLEITVARVAMGAGLMAVICAFGGVKIQLGLARLWRLAGVALFGNVLPFLLISWGQTRIDSSVAGVLMAVMPLSVLVFTKLLLPNDPLTRWHWIGFCCALGGIVVLMSPDLQWPLAGPIGGYLGVLAGALSYGLSAVIARSLPPASVWSNTMVLLVLALGLLVPIVAWVGADYSGVGMNAGTASVVFLGVFSTGLASALFFYVVSGTSAAFISNMNFLIPIWAVLLGALWLHEPLPATTVAAMALVLAGVAVAQRQAPRRSA